MRTRSSPSRSELLNWAKDIKLSQEELRLPKDKLYTLLQDKVDLNRFERRSRRYERQLVDSSIGSLNNSNKRKKRQCSKRHVSNLQASKKRKLIESALERSQSRKRRCKLEKNKSKSICQKISASCRFEEEFDPITREPLGKHVFKYFRPNGTCVKYDAPTLAEYILSTGDFYEPISRLEFAADDLKRLDHCLEKAGFKKSSVYHAFRHKDKYYEKALARDALLGLERCIGEVVYQMLRIIEAVSGDLTDRETAETELALNIFPVFTHYLSLLRGLDEAYAKQCIEQYITFVKGPPNKPTSNFLGFRDDIVQFLRQLKNF